MLDERTINFLESSHVPNVYWKDKSETYLFWFRALYERLCATLEFTLPENWSREYFDLVLFARGAVPVFNTARWGTTFNGAYNFIGYDWFFEPTHVQISNPKLTKKFTIGKDCEIIRLTTDGRGVFDIIAFYASKLNELSQGIDTAFTNAKLAIVLNAQNEAQAQTLAKVYDKMKQGNPLIIYDSKMTEFSDELLPQGDDPFQTFINNLKQTYIGTELIDNVNSIMNQFYREIGLVGESTEHGQSHTLNIEARQQESNSTARLDTWFKMLNDSINKVNKMFNIGLEVKRRECEISAYNNVERDGDAEYSDSGYMDA